jgi:DNA-binding transcriptional LysR family regulator
METDFLATFVLVAETGSMAEAARALDITPGAVAQQVRVIERQMGVSLVERSGRTVQPTEAGHRLLERARPLLQQTNDLRGWVNEATDSGQLRLGTINTALHSMLPETLIRFSVEYPGVRVYVQSGLSRELYEAVQKGDLDAAIGLQPDFELPKSIAWTALRREPLVVLAPAGHEQSDPHDLLRERPFIRYDRSLLGGKYADQYLKRHGIDPKERFELNALATIAMLVERNLGVSLVPDAVTAPWAASRIVRLRLPYAGGVRTFGMLRPRPSPRERLLQSLLEHGQAVCAEVAQPSTQSRV